MAVLQRIATRSARTARPHIQRQCRRKASDSHGTQPPEHTTPKDSHDHAAPKNESFGRGFFIALAAIPAGIAIIQYTREGQTPYFTRLIKEKYDEFNTSWVRRNDLHTEMVEQAGADRVLFLNESSRPMPEIRFPEQLNGGSPWNVGAGRSYANIDRVIEKYQKEASDRQAEKLQQLKDNAVPVEKPTESLIKKAPAPSN